MKTARDDTFVEAAAQDAHYRAKAEAELARLRAEKAELVAGLRAMPFRVRWLYGQLDSWAASECGQIIDHETELADTIIAKCEKE